MAVEIAEDGFDSGPNCFQLLRLAFIAHEGDDVVLRMGLDEQLGDVPTDVASGAEDEDCWGHGCWYGNEDETKNDTAY
jgi:hypothetical protein